MCLTAFKNFIANCLNKLFTRSINRGNAKAVAMDKNLQKYINHM